MFGGLGVNGRVNSRVNSRVNDRVNSRVSNITGKYYFYLMLDIITLRNLIL